MNGNPTSIRSDYRSRTSMLFDSLKKRALDIQILNHRFNDQIAIFDLREIVIEIPRRDERSEFRNKKRSRLRLHRSLKPAARNPAPHPGTLEREPLLLLLGRQFTRRNIEQ